MPNCGKRGGPRRCLLHSTGSSHAAPCWPLSRRINVRPKHQRYHNCENNDQAKPHEDRRPTPVNFRKFLVPCHSNN